MPSLERTPLYALHRQLGGRIVEFAGFEMPVQYSSIREEHAAVRERAGLFDVSHMGQIHFSGPKAVDTVERLVSCKVASLAVGAIRYGMLCNEAGGVVDDVTLYREADDALFLCVNAANRAKDLAWIESHAPAEAGVVDRSAETGMLALQGPSSPAVLAACADAGAAEQKRFRFGRFRVAGRDALVSCTGYTGSAGFEIYTDAKDVTAIFEALLEAGGGDGLVPAGLGARDTLRLEAALPLYGHELDDDTSPLEAGLDRFVKREVGGFIGAEAIERRAAAPAERVLAGFAVTGRGIARAGHALVHDGREVGTVTSGAPSPTLGKSIGLGYVPPALAEPGTTLDVAIRAKQVAIEIVETPFVRAR